MNGLKRIPRLDKLASSARAIDWRRRDVRDALAIGAFSLAVLFVANWYDLFGHIQVWTKLYEEWGLDEIFVMTAVLSGALLVYGYRRLQDLKREVAARRSAEKTAQHSPATTR